ncbi:MAG: cupin domain-containing protein [Actinomycetota bacterium]|nr:cupin domain-containing protein [Actinomycetota bacterium]
MQSRKVTGILAALTVAAGGVAAWSGLAQANGTGTHGVVRVEESNVLVEDRIRINEKSGSRVIVAHITVEPGGHTPWHYHPGPHIVSVKTGTVEVYETDCSSTSYGVGDGFFDPGRTHRPHIHTLRNPSLTDRAEVVITDIRDRDLRPTIVADQQPAPCFS